MEAIKYIGNGQIRVEGKTVARKGDVIRYNEIPADAFVYFAKRADFEEVTGEQPSSADPSPSPDVLDAIEGEE